MINKATFTFNDSNYLNTGCPKSGNAQNPGFLVSGVQMVINRGTYLIVRNLAEKSRFRMFF